MSFFVDSDSLNTLSRMTNFELYLFLYMFTVNCHSSNALSRIPNFIAAYFVAFQKCVSSQKKREAFSKEKIWWNRNKFLLVLLD